MGLKQTGQLFDLIRPRRVLTFSIYQYGITRSLEASLTFVDGPELEDSCKIVEPIVTIETPK